MENVKVKLTGIKMREGEDIKKKLMETRKLLGVHPDHFPNIKRENIYRIENVGESMRSTTFTNYLKSLGIKKFTVIYNQGVYKIKCSFKDIGGELRKIREQKGLKMFDFWPTQTGYISVMETGKFNSYVQSYIEYAKRLEVKELTIIL